VTVYVVRHVKGRPPRAVGQMPAQPGMTVTPCGDPVMVCCSEAEANAWGWPHGYGCLKFERQPPAWTLALGLWYAQDLVPQPEGPGDASPPPKPAAARPGPAKGTRKNKPTGPTQRTLFDGQESKSNQ
jgi:hypothetical protein